MPPYSRPYTERARTCPNPLSPKLAGPRSCSSNISYHPLCQCSADRAWANFQVSSGAEVLLYLNGTSVLSLCWRQETRLAMSLLELIRPLPSAFPAITEHLFSWPIVVISWLPISSPSVPVSHGESDLSCLIPCGLGGVGLTTWHQERHMTPAYPMRLYIPLAAVICSFWACDPRKAN